MKKIFLIFFLLFFITSCFNSKKEDIKLTDEIGNSGSIQNNTGKLNQDVNIFSGSLNKIKPVVFKDKNINKIDSFFVGMNNAKFLTGAELKNEKPKLVEKRQYANLKIEISGQLPILMSSMNEYAQKIGTGSKKESFLQTPDGIQFERIILMLDNFDFKKDFKGMKHYKVEEEQKKFENFKKLYQELKSKK